MTIEACAALVERGDPDRFLSVMAAPVWARRVLLPLYAFNLEVARAPWLTSEPMIAEMRLQWWRDVLDEIAGPGEVRHHEVATVLGEILDPAGAGILHDLIDARHWDIVPGGFSSEDSFAEHLDRTSGTLMWVAARALGADATGAEAVIRGFAWGQGLAAWFQAIPALEAAGCQPLIDGRPGAVQLLAREGLRRIRLARRSRHAVPAVAGPALLAGWRAAALLRQVARDPMAVAEGRLGLSEFRRRGTLLCRAATGRW